MTLLAFLWPVFLLIALLIRLDSKGPAVFRQRRYGLNGEEFPVYKFRTMTVCEDGGEIVQAKPNDPRITRLGRFLRRTSLDELPQLFCVLAGSMSLVGPRPHAVAHNEQYRHLIDGYMLRHKVRPGITGWAQVNGLRGETRTVDQMRARVLFDLEYLRHWSPWIDIKILLRTALLVVRDRNAY
jgi:putative colanic acid biosynthesis UDP-glucose lipid carrier transferase